MTDDAYRDDDEKKDEKKDDKKSVAFKATSSKGKTSKTHQVKMKAHFLGIMMMMRRWLSL